MITLYAFGPALGITDPSPFVLKIDAYMRMAKIPFESIGKTSNLQKAPKGKLPFIKDSGEVIADSSFILKHLEQKHHVQLDEHLSPEQVAQTVLISKAIEEGLYWCIVYFRWIYPKNWQIIKQLFFSQLPFPLSKIIPVIANKGVKKAMHGHGMGRHSEQEILAIAQDHLEALNTLIGNKPFCFGDQPSSLDATVYAFLAEILLVELESPLSELAKSYPNLMKYCEHFNSHFY